MITIKFQTRMKVISWLTKNSKETAVLLDTSQLKRENSPVHRVTVRILIKTTRFTLKDSLEITTESELLQVT